ncbi:MAG: hypothetical protein A2381_17080 [Bdellovibrionales bacterium RIFOXYB1_FULL_37_110]|nr:MAG: hypothetical protein A2181_08085 [Bdellovibrionales bacterium RIFOXYA1_FULL_38_20]OFZ50111.1 MAG: hypothetical protein A2417_18915 [Bdellovibrionales bacterium RIFOXYC1_FULL_37_79]OFZ60017.1 MAG: hypothetical protein A2381_17080 [Bdellovibrionales bacterium RIFOXYB1_FULL_37_110]OFZ64260.1 MAG: hypothetical protein A2577_12575 [Bdellovibrionales bacterium RIFOXYD1_FULL_36_51]
MKYSVLFLMSVFLPLSVVASFNCNSLNYSNEKSMLKSLQDTTDIQVMRCLSEEAFQEVQQVRKYFNEIYNLILNMPGLPKELLTQWRMLKYEQVRFYTVDFDLCLQNSQSECDPSTVLTAKNHRIGDRGFIFINEKLWNDLPPVDKYSLVWHEALGVLDFEKNAYRYSSMVDFSVKYITSLKIESLTSDRYITATIHDPSFLK